MAGASAKREETIEEVEQQEKKEGRMRSASNIGANFISITHYLILIY